MFFEQFETEIKNRLQEKLGNGVEVELEPETEAANKTPFTKPRVSVMFDQSEFEKQNSTAYIAQHETCRAAIIIRARRLRGEGGVYAVVENVRRYLAGYAPGNWSKIWLVKFSFLRRENNLWEYALIIASKSMIVEEAAPETGPTLVTGTTTNTNSQFN